MFKTIEKFLKDQLNRIVFIELKKDAVIESKFNCIKEVPVPILVNELVDPIKEKTESEDISLASMARGMIYAIGIDSNFKYKDDYKSFLYAFHEKIEDYICYKGIKCAEEKEFLDALIFFKALIVVNKDNINGLYNYAKCCQDIIHDMQDKAKIEAFEKESLEAFEILNEKFPYFAPAYYFLGFHYVNQKLYKKAQLMWVKCMELDINDEKKKECIFQLDRIKDQVQYEEGYSYVLNNQPDKGIEKLLPLVEKYSDWWNLLFFIGLAHRQLHNFIEAIEYFQKIMQHKPTQSDTLNELGLCHASLKNFDEAEKYFNKALKYNGEDSEILSNLALVYMETGKLELAKEAFQRSIQINPDDEITKKCIAKLESMLK